MRRNNVLYLITIQANEPQGLDRCRFRDVTRKQWKKQADVTLGGIPFSLRVIKRQLWACCLEYGVVVFDRDLKQQRTVPYNKTTGWVHDASAMSNGDVILATDKGIYQLHGDGKYVVVWILFSDRQTAEVQYNSRVLRYSIYLVICVSHLGCAYLRVGTSRFI